LTSQLLRKKDDEGFKSGDIGDATEAALEVIPRDLHMRDVTVSGAPAPCLLPYRKLINPGKLSLLDRMLYELHSTTKEKVVVVSNWTATLNIIQEVAKKRHWPFMRLDGSTAAKERQGLVDSFNRETRDQSFIFLLSAKAGGVGLNLIG
jgi:DNA repair and recombination protein RAD54B